MDNKKLCYAIVVIIAIIILIVILFIMYDHYKYTNLAVTNGGGSGNVLCEYVVISAYYIADKKDIKCHDISVVDGFFSWLPTDIRYRKEWDYMSSELRSLVSKMSYIDIFTAKCSDWKIRTGILCIMQNWYRKIIKSTFPYPKTYHNVIIHYRCSDAPFNHSIHYEMVKYSWYLEALNIAKNHVDINQITILACYQHKSNVCEANICDIYAHDLMDYLSERVKAEIKIGCGSVEDDFLAMAHADCLISPSSSLSFMAGYGSDNIFIHGVDSKFICDYGVKKGYRDGMIPLCSDPYIIPHGNIDYIRDHEDVIQKLRS